MEELGTVRQQIGEILGTVRGLADQMREQKEEGRRQDDRISSEMRTIKHDARQNEQILASRLELLTNQVKELDVKARGIVTEITGLKIDMTELKDPVAKLTELKNKVMAYILVFISITTVVLYLIHPILNSMIDSLVKKIFG